MSYVSNTACGSVFCMWGNACIKMRGMGFSPYCEFIITGP